MRKPREGHIRHVPITSTRTSFWDQFGLAVVLLMGGVAVIVIGFEVVRWAR